MMSALTVNISMHVCGKHVFCIVDKILYCTDKMSAFLVTFSREMTK